MWSGSGQVGRGVHLVCFCVPQEVSGAVMIASSVMAGAALVSLCTGWAVAGHGLVAWRRL